MSCNCPTPSELPQIPAPVEECPTCPESESVSSEGSVLPNCWLDSVCAATGVTLLGRVGSRLARLAGSGFIKLENGVASVVSSVPLRATVLWHRLWKSSQSAPPQIGEPLPFPYQVIANTEGVLHSIKGVGDQNSLSLWDHEAQTFTQTPVSEIEHTKKGAFVRGTDLELTGFAPIAEGGSTAAVRPEKVLSGAGVVYLVEQPTVDPSCDCAPGAGTASVARTLALPVPAGSETYTLKYSTALGLHWSED